MLSTPMSVSSRRHSIVGKLLHRWNNLSLRIKGFAVVAIPLIPLLTTAVLLLFTERQERTAEYAGRSDDTRRFAYWT